MCPVTGYTRATWATSTATVTNGPTWTTGGGSAAITTGGYVTTTGTATFYPGTVGPFTSQPLTTLGPLDAVAPWHRLNQEQMARVMRSHDFIPMDGDQCRWCLLCYALDQPRTEADHRFTIREE